jgi:membrane protein YqaA with SNARE-associated domain
VSFVEALLPVPLITDPFLVAGIMANRKNAVWLVVVTTVASIAGGVIAFLMALLFFDFLSTLMTPGVRTEFESLLTFGESDTFLATIVGAVTPIPYTIVAWVIAAAGGSLGVFILGSALGRGFRYVIVGYGAYTVGPKALQYVRRSIITTTLVIALFVALYIYVKL